LRVELHGSGIDVSIINPGATQTEFGDSIRHGDVTQKFKAMGHVQSAEEVAQAIVRCIKYPKVEVYPYRTSRLLVWANAVAPSLVDKIIRRFLREGFALERTRAREACCDHRCRLAGLSCAIRCAGAASSNDLRIANRVGGRDIAALYFLAPDLFRNTFRLIKDLGLKARSFQSLHTRGVL